MRLLFISNLFPDAGHAYLGLDNATVLHALSREFEIRAMAPRPTLFFERPCVPRDVDRPFSPRYVKARYIPKIGSRWNHRLMARALEPVVAGERFDVVLSSWIYPDSCAVSLLARKLGFRFVCIAQGSDVHQYLKIPARRQVILESMSRSSGIITRSANLAHLLAGAGVAREKLHPVYNGVDLALFQPADPQKARRELGLDPAARIILFVGNFVEIKNPLALLAAHARMEKPCQLVMIGQGPMRDQLRGENVLLVGRKSAPEVAAYMQAADVLCLPSFNEGVPNVILEAFASGLPVVASGVGGIPEVLREDFLGALSNPASLDSLVTALNTVLNRPRETAKIREHGLQFSWSNTAAGYAKLLREAVA